jgi:hypothetical protein
MGIIKLMFGLESIHLTFAGSFMNVPVVNNLFFIFMVNFLGGFSFLFHAIKTLNYKKENLVTVSKSEIIDDEVEAEIGLKEMSRPVMLSGSYSIIIGLWFILSSVGLILLAYKFGVVEFVELFTVVLLISIASGLIPIILVSKNIALSSKIRKRKERQKIALYHSKIKNSGTNRRR